MNQGVRIRAFCVMRVICASAALFGLLPAVGALAQSSLPQSSETEISGRAIVKDGDSLMIDGKEIRLHAIDAPELRQSCKDKHTARNIACGHQARRFLQDLIETSDQTVRCRITDEDRFGRLIGRCFTGTRNLGEEMVRAGMAVAYTRYSVEHVAVETEARRAERGLWGMEFQIPEIWRFQNPIRKSRGKTSRQESPSVLSEKPVAGEVSAGPVDFRRIDFRRGVEAYRLGDYQRAYKEWLLLAQQGKAEAQHNLGALYYYGRGVEQSVDQAAIWFLRAARQGYTDAAFAVGVLFYKGRGFVRNYRSAEEWFRKAADQGHAKAAAYIGLMYDQGHGVARNHAEALKWFQLAAQRGNADGCFKMGIYAASGRLGAPDPHSAAEWYECAVSKGHNDARHNLGLLYVNGRGVAKNYHRARELFEAAALEGHASSQYNMGVLYTNGLGVQKDLIDAYAWLRIAQDNGHKGASNAVRRLAKILKQNQRLQGEEKRQNIRNRITAPRSPSSDRPPGPVLHFEQQAA